MKITKRMKQLALLGLSAALALGLCACGGGDGDSFTTVEQGKLIMSTSADFPPYEMVADNGQFEGIDVEIAQAIAKKLGLELVIDDCGFDPALLAVQNGQSDIAMSGISITEQRLEVMDFSDSYTTAVQVVIVKEGSGVTLDNMGSKLIGAAIGYTGHMYCVEDYGEEHVAGYESGASAVQALINGQVDCVVIDSEPAKEFVKANADQGLVILDTEYAVEDYAIGLAKGNDALKEAVNKAIAEMKADGSFQNIVDKYIK